MVTEVDVEGVVVTVMNMKGGVGKTTVTANLGPALALGGTGQRQRKVLLVDYDAQFSLSQCWLSAAKLETLWQANRTSLDIIQDKAGRGTWEIRDPANIKPPAVATLAERVLSWQGGGSLDIVASTMDLMEVALGRGADRAIAAERRFQTFMSEARQLYDIILIDCHPAGSLLTRTAVLQADHLLIPVTDSPFASRGARLMRTFLERTRPDAKVPFWILFNGDPPSAQNSAAERDVRADDRLKDHCLSAKLPKQKAYSDLRAGFGWVGHSGKPYSTKAWRSLIRVADEMGKKLQLGSPS